MWLELQPLQSIYTVSRLVIEEEDIQFPASQDTLTPQQTQLANDYKNIITALGLPTAGPPGQRSELGTSRVVF